MFVGGEFATVVFFFFSPSLSLPPRVGRPEEDAFPPFSGGAFVCWINFVAA